MKIEFDPSYDALTTESYPNNDVMFAAVGRRHVLPLTGYVEQFVDSVKPGQKGARFVVDPRWGFQPGFTITLDIEALVLEPCCDSQPCDCPSDESPVLQLVEDAAGDEEFDPEVYGNDPEQAGS